MLYPVNTVIYGPCFEDAIKYFVKLNYAMGIREIIANDAQRRYRINLRQYRADTRNRVGFDVYRYTGVPPPPIYPVNNFRFWNPTAQILYNGIPHTIGIPYLLQNYRITNITTDTTNATNTTNASDASDGTEKKSQITINITKP